MVATDVAARGVHVDDIELVIHVDPPAEHKAYLHRSGRTARAGKEGEVVTIMLPAQRKDTEALLRKAAIKVTPQKVTATSEAVIALVGEVAAYVKPSERTGTNNAGSTGGNGRSQGANAQRKSANRNGQQPRTDRSGRPARSGSATGEGRGQRSDQPRAAQPQRAAQAPASGEPRRATGPRRAGAAAGRPTITVGSVVRPNGGARRSSSR